MSVVCAQGLGFGYSDRVPILNQVCFRLSQGWYGLVGANGAGKSTLAHLIVGALQSTAGRVWVEPAGARVILCEQSVDPCADGLARFATLTDRESCRWRGLLRLEQAALARWTTLSPGERKRWQIAAALAADSEVLIVDEPTNHLDAEARALVIEALRRYVGVGILVSHDRELLGALTTRTLRIHQTAVELYPATYTGAKAIWESNAERALATREQWVEHKRRIENRINVANHEKQAAHQKRSAGHRMKNRHDHDASSIMADGRAANGEAAICRKISNMAAELARTKSKIPTFVQDKTACKHVFVDYRPSATPRVLGLDGEDLPVGNQILLRDVRVTLGRMDRIHLKGPNGCGKSTLMGALLARATANRNQLLWLPQELSSEEVAALREASGCLPHLERGRLMTLLVALGVELEHLWATQCPSPGEARKLKLAFGLATHAAALVLDEPTNHLDLPSIERLEAALCDFPGAILLVSHDESFARACTSHTWEIRDHRVYT